MLLQYVPLHSSTELPPEFTRPLQNQEINEGEAAIFECELNIDNTTAKWFHEGREISDNRRYNIVREGTVHRLIITDAIVPDAGDITAKVEDKSTTATLTVHGEAVQLRGMLWIIVLMVCYIKNFQHMKR